MGENIKESTLTVHATPKKNLQWTFNPLKHMLQKHFLGWAPDLLKSVAFKSWEISPGETTISPPAFYLPNQLERISGWAFTEEHPRRLMEGGVTNEHSPTMAYLIKDTWLLDGTLYKNNAASFLQTRSRKLPQFHAPMEIDKAAIYCTPGGNEFFGQWLLDDCATYRLTNDFGIPVTTTKNISAHTYSYKVLLDMTPLHYENVFFKELIVFDDVGQNLNKRSRFHTNREKVLAGIDAKPHPGVFIIRGNSGMLRTLSNESALAEHLRDTRGFRILDPMSTDVETIRTTCAGAQTIIGVEGSHLIHGLMTLRENCSLVSLMPPNRFFALNKHITDRDHQHFGFVVGTSDGDGFHVNIEEVDRTLDLLPKSTSY